MVRTCVEYKNRNGVEEIFDASLISRLIPCSFSDEYEVFKREVVLDQMYENETFPGYTSILSSGGKKWRTLERAFENSWRFFA